MGWSVGYDDTRDRDIGYGVPAICDHPKCNARIDRGLAYVCCNQEPYGGDGCGLFFCYEHVDFEHRCPRCRNRKPPYQQWKPDVRELIQHKLTDESWGKWREENPSEVAWLKEKLDSSPVHGECEQPA
jgi:hypothetical protein